MTKVRVGIIGGAGYTGGELLRLLLHHPYADVVFSHSASQQGRPVAATHTDLLGDTDLVFTGEDPATLLPRAEVVFLCSGHGASKKFLQQYPTEVRLIDLSADFRDESDGFVYGLPELQRGRIGAATRIANPGCFATAIELALLPLAAAGHLRADVHVSAITGSTGAGQALSETGHFSWRSHNVSSYKVFSHQHLAEIGMALRKLDAGFQHPIHFVPYRGGFTRGILASVYLPWSGSPDAARQLYADYYAPHPFTHVSEADVDVKQVVNTNKALLHLQTGQGQLLITSVIDNLVKGAAGQAVQNLNLMLGLPEATGLHLKAVAF